MDNLLNDSIIKQVEDFFAQLTGRVKILVFTDSAKSEPCEIAVQLVSEVASLSDKISLIVVDSVAKPGLAQQYGVIGKAPAIVIAALDTDANGGEVVTDLGIRILGVPAGHEFGVLMQDILLVSGRNSGLSEQARLFIKNLKEPVHLEVFATPG